MEAMLLVDRYAKALVSVARQENRLEQLDRELSVIEEILAHQPKLREIFLNPAISIDEKQALIEDLLHQARISSELKMFIFLLLKARRLNLFAEISKLYRDLIYSLRRRIKVRVESAFSLDRKQKEALGRRLSDIYQRKIDLSVRLNRSLLGGARVYLGHKLYEATVKGQLALLKEHIWKE